MRIEYHRTLVSDRVRNAAFHAALKAVIKPGETVVADIGAGTGLLGMMAAKLGAKEVFLYEEAEVAGLAADLLKRNRANNCLLLACSSLEMERPPRVDVVVSETLGNYPLEENIIATMRDAKKRHLKPGGVVIPGRISQFVTLVTTGRVHGELTSWDEVGYGIDFRLARTMSLNNIYVRTLAPTDLLEGGRRSVQWDAFDLSQAESTTRSGTAEFKLTEAAKVHGLAIWWSAELAPGVVLSTAPDAPRTHWEQLYLPMLDPVDAKAGDTISVSLRSRTTSAAGTTLNWAVTHRDGGGRQISRQAMDLEKGYLP